MRERRRDPTGITFMVIGVIVAILLVIATANIELDDNFELLEDHKIVQVGNYTSISEDNWEVHLFHKENYLGSYTGRMGVNTNPFKFVRYYRAAHVLSTKVKKDKIQKMKDIKGGKDGVFK